MGAYEARGESGACGSHVALAIATVGLAAAALTAGLALAGPMRGCSAGPGGEPAAGAVGNAAEEDPAGTGQAADFGRPAGEGAPLAPPDARVAERVTVPKVCKDKGALAETLESATGSRATWEVDAGLEDAAASVIEGYRDEAGLTLEHDGYLDLLGHVWSCVVVSEEGWSEVALVDERGEADDFGPEEGAPGRCLVTVARLGGAGALAGEGALPSHGAADPEGAAAGLDGEGAASAREGGSG